MSLDQLTVPAGLRTCCENLPDVSMRRVSGNGVQRLEYLPVFKDFGGRIYHLAVQVRCDASRRSDT